MPRVTKGGMEGGKTPCGQGRCRGDGAAYVCVATSSVTRAAAACTFASSSAVPSVASAASLIAKPSSCNTRSPQNAIANSEGLSEKGMGG